MPKQPEKIPDTMRLDKWLWCARFYKTRSMATDAIKSGRIMVNGERAKPSRMVEPGSRISIKRPPYTFDIKVVFLPHTRKSASEALQIYQETPASIEKRENISAQLKLDAMVTPRTDGKPTKRDRRQLLRFKNRN